MKKKKTVYMFSILVLLALGGFLLKPLSKGEMKTQLRSAELKRGDLENTISSTGILSALETVQVGSQVSGIIQTIHADYNDRVRKGQLLAELDETLLQVSVEEALARRDRAQAAYNQAKAERIRNHPLFKKGHLSEQEYLVSKTTEETALSDLNAANASLRKAQVQLGYAKIYSPIGGTVIERTIDEGQTIAANFQAPKLFIIAKDLDKMQIEVSVDESDIGLIRQGQSVRFSVQAYPDDTFPGVVRQIRLQPVTVQNVVNYTVVVDASNSKGKLLPGMTATVEFIVSHRRDILLVPNSAIHLKVNKNVYKLLHGHGNQAGNSGKKEGFQKGAVLYVLDAAGQVNAVPYQKGSSDGMFTEIQETGALKPGVRVVTGFDKKRSKAPAFTLPTPGGGPPK